MEGMKKRALVVAIALVVAAASAAAVYFFLLPPKPAPAPGPPPAVEAPAAKPAWNSVINLYFADPVMPPGTTERIELTLLKAALASPGREDVPVFEGATRIVLQRNVAEQVLSAAAPYGQAKTLKLTFSPVAQVVSQGGVVTTMLVEPKETSVALDADLPQGRTLFAMVRVPLDRVFGVRNGVPIFSPPNRLEARSVLLGGSYLTRREVGALYTLTNATLADVVKADLGIDINVKPLQPGTGFVPPTSAP